jgi:phosphatidylglycerophosphate synthase
MSKSGFSYQDLLTWPNLLTCFRFLAAPVLLGLAWHGKQHAFLILLAVSFLTDALDGFIARLTGQVSELGATLDSWADVTLYLTIAVSAWWLWPERVKQESIAVSVILGSCLLPALVGMLKFGSFTSYHTFTVKIAAACVAVSLYALFLVQWGLPIQIAAGVCVLAAGEEIAISLLLKEKRSNISSLWKLWRSR